MIFYAPHHRETDHYMDFDSDFFILSCTHVFPINHIYRSNQDLNYDFPKNISSIFYWRIHIAYRLLWIV